jgi:organic hydroperoxide reductase OsmC/OhrA
MTKTDHAYTARLIWDGNTGQGTARYTDYERNYRVVIAGKPDIAGSADAAFRGNADRHNPEDLFLAAIAACHMLFFLSLCARRGVRVLAYEDEAHGTMAVDADGGGRFTGIVLHPVVVLEDAGQTKLATQLHELAHQRCFIANSCRVPIRPIVTVRARESATDRSVTSSAATQAP